MSDYLNFFKNKGLSISEEITDLLYNAKSVKLFNTHEELIEASTLGSESGLFEVRYDIPGKGLYTEAIIHKVKNGISANYTEAYMRRRDPNTMVIADNKPTDKVKFTDRFGYDFAGLKKETYDWLKAQDLSVFFYFAGRDKIGSWGIAIVPENAGFFALGLAMLQKLVHIDDLPNKTHIDSVIYVAPPFRHTHFEGKQIVVHNRLEDIHEVYSYNLYPGPSAKKGLYGVLLDIGEKENWVTTHCSTVVVKSPYDNITTIMHEGASGGGKSEMLQYIVREPEGQVLIGTNLVSGEKRMINIPVFCTFNPVTDDMALVPPSIQTKNGKITVLDAENGWFIRVDGIKKYGDEPFLENLTINSPKPLLYFNLETKPGCTALIWDHVEDEPGKTCPNPRVIIPRDCVPKVIEGSVNVDVRSFGVRTRPCTAEDPSYGIIGMFHILPPALAWLWRLVSPRGYGNPSIVSSETMGSEGVGSYWPFATGLRNTHANLLLKQIMRSQRTRFTLTPNQHIGVWEVGFKPQLLMREYLTRRGNAKLRSDQFQPARCPLLGYELNYLTIEGSKIPSRFLKVYKQDEVGEAGYDAGAEILTSFFNEQLPQYLKSGLNKTGKMIIQACLDGATTEDYLDMIPMEYEYSFKNLFIE
ncbi:MAG: DUF4914 family protein [Bacteroidales bacterium]|nr:DUF4914 family protein [Bacteroidales bacterium]MCF8405876.1 DUF4914 family protein [Bacteroidales bacterium]